MRHQGEGWAQKWTSSGYQELYTPYYTIKLCSITLPVAYLLTYKKPESDPLSHCRNTLLKTRRVARGVARRTNMNTNLFVLNFCIHVIYIYTSLYLWLQAIQAYSACPVEGDSGQRWPQIQWSKFPRSLPHLGIMGAKAIGTRTHRTKC